MAQCLSMYLNLARLPSLAPKVKLGVKVPVSIHEYKMPKNKKRGREGGRKGKRGNA